MLNNGRVHTLQPVSDETNSMSNEQKQAYLQSLLSHGFTNGSDILASSGRHRMTQKNAQNK